METTLFPRFEQIRAFRRTTWPPRLALHCLLLAGPLLALCFALYATLGADAEIAAWFKAWRPGHRTEAALLRCLTDWTNVVFSLVYAAIFLYGYRRGDRRLMRLAVCYACFQIAISFGAVRILKIALGRPRPGVEGAFVFFSLDSGHHSLPSGHSAEIVGALLPLALWRKSLALSLGLGLIIGVMAFSRVALGWHFPSDTLAGAGLGAVSGLLIYSCWISGQSLRAVIDKEKHNAGSG